MSRRVKTSAWVLSFVALTCQVNGNPVNPVVQHGGATFSSSGSTSLIHQSSDRVIIHWDSFSIAAGETTRFVQPGVNSAALNRVVTGAPSAIHGSLQANGQVYLINPNGILIGPGGRVDTAGFLASTLDVPDAEFLAGGDMTFSGNSRARVTNLGTVTSIDGGDIFLIAKEVINHGALTAETGTVGLAGGTRVLVRAEGMDERISILPGSEDGSVTNGTAGQVQAVVAELKAAGGNEYALAVNNKGLVRATGFQRRGGKVYLGSSRGRISNRGRVESREVKVEAPEAPVINEGTIEADESIEIEAGIIDLTSGSGLLRARSGGTIALSATESLRIQDTIDADNDAGMGGSIRLSATEILVGNGAEITANGSAGGGQILVGGGRAGRDASIANAQNTTVEAGSLITANALPGGNGAGGEVILWADGGQDFRGAIEARGDGAGAGGFVEVSGLETLSFLGSVDTGGGDLLLDPFNYTIGATEASAIEGALATNSVTIETTANNPAFGSSGNNTDLGDITLNSAISWTSGNSLTLNADNDIAINAAINSGGGAVTLEADRHVTSDGNGTITTMGGPVKTTGGDITIRSALGGTGGDINLAGAITAAGITAGFTGTNAGSVILDATGGAGVGGSITSASINASGGDATNFLPVGGNAGVIDLDADGSVVVNGAVQAVGGIGRSDGGAGGGISIDAGSEIRLVSLDSSGGRSDNTGRPGGNAGSINLTAGDALTATDAIRAVGGRGAGNGGAGGAVTMAATSAVDLFSIDVSGGAGISLLGGTGGRVSVTTSGTIRVGPITSHGGIADTRFIPNSNPAGDAGTITLDNTSGSSDITLEGTLSAAGGQQILLNTFGADGTVAIQSGGAIVDGSPDDSIDNIVAGETSLTAQTGIGVGDNLNTRAGNNGNLLLAAETVTGDIDISNTGSLTVGTVGGLTGVSITGNAPGDVSLSAASPLFINASVVNNTGGDSNFLATGDITFNASVQNRNATGGDINIVAGWDGTTAYDTATFSAVDVTAATPTLFGNGNGSVKIGDGTQALGVAVGSRSGTTNVFGHDVTLQGGNNSLTNDGRFAQLGFQVSDGVAQDGTDLGAAPVVDGAITVHVRNDLSATGGNDWFNYAQLGHVGADVLNDTTIEATATSMIEITAGHDIIFEGGSEREAYAQLGQGGKNADGNHSGTTTITSANDITFTGGNGIDAYAQLGQGGSNANGNHDGTTTITRANDITFRGGSVVGYAQLGQGGAGSNGNHSGTTTITSANDITFTGGGGFRAYAQLGQGGSNANGNHDGTTTITRANDITFRGGNGTDAYAQLGQGGIEANGNHSGTTTTTSANDITFTGGSGRGAHAQLGQGGAGSNGNHSGTTTITIANDITFTGGGGDHSYAQLGQGGRNAGGNHSGTTTITSANDITFTGGGGFIAYAQLGQGGYNADGDHNGTTTITIANNITFTGGSVVGYAQLGQGGIEANGNHSGTTTITSANDITFTGGGVNAYAQLGQGGAGSNGNHSGATTITSANDITFRGGSRGAYAQLGQGRRFAEGNHSGTIDVTLEGDLVLTGIDVEDQYAIIGHGDEPGDGDAPNTVSGDVTVRVRGNATLTNAFVGHQIDPDGTYTSGNTFFGVVGDLTADGMSQFTSAPVGTGELRIYLGGADNVNAATMLNGTAHGGVATPNNQGMHAFGTGPYTANPGADGNFAYYRIEPDIYNYTVGANESAAIVASLAVGDVALDRNLGQFDFGAVYDWDGGTQFITVNEAIHYDSMNRLSFLTTGDVDFHASVQNRNDTGGDINVVAGWDGTTAFDAATFSSVNVNFAPTLYGNRSGSVNVGEGTQTTGIAVGSRSESTNVYANDVVLQAGNGVGDNRFAQIGFRATDGISEGGIDLDPGAVGGDNVDITGRIAVHATNDLILRAGDSGNYVYAQIGHIGGDSSANLIVDAAADGKIEITVDADIEIRGAWNEGAYAQIGHGGSGSSGNRSGIIHLTEADDIRYHVGFIGRFPGQGAYSQIGHGGYATRGNSSGDILIGRVELLSGTNARSRNLFTQIGHGGENSFGSHKGDIRIAGVKEIFAGSQIGHGGKSSSGSQSGDIVVERSESIQFGGQLGHGGENAVGDHDGDITVTDVESILFGGAQLGHGGENSRGNHTGHLSIRGASTRRIEFSGGAGSGGQSRAAQFGHGGIGSVGNYSGDIIIDSAGVVSFIGGFGGFASPAQLGHGGIDTEGDFSGSITVISSGNIDFVPDRRFGGQDGYALLGHGGSSSDGAKSGNISINSGGSVRIGASSRNRSLSRVGHGGSGASGVSQGNITVVVEGDLTLSAGGLGHGDQFGNSDVGDTVAGNVSVQTVGSATLDNAFIGHQIDADGIYASGNTFIGVGEDGSPSGGMETLTASERNRFNSAPTGELRFYIPEPAGYQIAAGTFLNGTAAPTPGARPLPNEQGLFSFGTGPYDLRDPGNFAFYFKRNPPPLPEPEQEPEPEPVPTLPAFQLPDSIDSSGPTDFFLDSRFIQPAGPLEDDVSILDWWEAFFNGWLENSGEGEFSEPLEFLPEGGFINTLGSSEVDD